MNLTDTKYTQFALVREMLESIDLVMSYLPEISDEVIADIMKKNKVFIAAEGSSRIFPAQNVIYNALRFGSPAQFFSEGAMQAMEYQLDDYHVFGVSNSGKTKEVVKLFTKLKEMGNVISTGVACHENVPLNTLSTQFLCIDCGEEEAVAATKSVMCQALFFDTLLAKIKGEELPDKDLLSDALREVLTTDINPNIIRKISRADKVFFAGRNKGVAEELALKTNEITRQQSHYLPGTFILHGIEEVITSNDVIILVNPYESELQKIKEIYIDEIGAEVIAITNMETPFDAIRLPQVDPVYKGYVALAAGWNILVETGIARGVNLDKPERARKIGNEFSPETL